MRKNGTINIIIVNIPPLHVEQITISFDTQN